MVARGGSTVIIEINSVDDFTLFKVDRLQIIVVAKKYIYVSQLFISTMPLW